MRPVGFRSLPVEHLLVALLFPDSFVTTEGYADASVMFSFFRRNRKEPADKVKVDNGRKKVPTSKQKGSVVESAALGIPVIAVLEPLPAQIAQPRPEQESARSCAGGICTDISDQQQDLISSPDAQSQVIAMPELLPAQPEQEPARSCAGEICTDISDQQQDPTSSPDAQSQVIAMPEPLPAQPEQEPAQSCAGETCADADPDDVIQDPDVRECATRADVCPRPAPDVGSHVLAETDVNDPDVRECATRDQVSLRSAVGHTPVNNRPGLDTCDVSEPTAGCDHPTETFRPQTTCKSTCNNRTFQLNKQTKQRPKSEHKYNATSTVLACICWTASTLVNTC